MLDGYCIFQMNSTSCADLPNDLWHVQVLGAR